MNRFGQILTTALLALLFFSGAAWASGYKTVNPAGLKAMQAHKDFFLLVAGLKAYNWSRSPMAIWPN